MKKISPLKTDISLFTIAFVWALNFTVVKASLSEFDPYTFNAIRFILAASFLWFAIAKKSAWFSIHRDDWKWLIPLGLLGNLLYQWLFIIGINYTYAANAAVMLGTIPIWVALFSHIMKMEKMNRFKSLGIIFAFSGVVLIVIYGKNPISFGSDTFIGDLLIITAAMVWGFFTILSKQFLSRYTPLQFSAIMTSIGAIALTTIAIPFIPKTQWSSISAGAWGGAIYSGLLAIGLAYLIWNNGILKVGAVKTAAYQNLVPVLGLLFGIIILRETLEWLQYVGSAVVIAGVLLTRYGKL